MISNPSIYKLKMYIYWLDLIVSFALFLIFFIYTLNYGTLLTLLLSSVVLYRVGAFTHEICHQKNNPRFKIFKLVWNLTIGCLMFQPSLRFCKPHLQHHKVGVFATEKDPQYPLIFKDSFKAFFIFTFLPYILPLYNILICFIPFKNNILSSIFYKDKFSSKECKELLAFESYYIFVLIFSLVYLSPYLLLYFYLVSVGAWYLSVLRIPLEHPLNEYKKVSTKKDQERLSYTHYSVLYALIQPLGLRFHTVHHMYPKIPYYMLKSITNKVLDK